ncbi:ribonuclease P protein component-like protein [Leptospira ilyithenensis]|uniref:Ribonuclease P protein component-like protein n=1 Tax=Leptospira ilyithenensis TaxID=2484901 RepID=A0A4V3JWM0_9LEPT|nr:ribonuclease P protein component-like protein [Leptospira ilyithenensis]
MQELFRSAKKAGRFPISFLSRKNGTENTCFLFCPDRSHKSAVDRNRTKRLLKELVRLHLSAFPAGNDIAILAHIDFARKLPKEREEIFLSIFQKPQ